jgi:hypothetical protein
MNPVIVQLRVMQIMFIVSVLLFILFLYVNPPATQSVDVPVQWGIVCCAIASALSGFSVQRMLRRAPSQSLADTHSSTPRSRWFAGHLIRFATAESVALFGFALRMMGDSSNVVIALFACSLLLLAVWQPGEIPAATESHNPIR